MTSPSNLARLPQEHIKTVQGAILDKFLFHLGKSGNRMIKSNPLRALALGTIASAIASLANADSLRVIDGDTFVTSSNERIRVWGLDCPERAAPEGPAATRAARILLEGNRVILSRIARDRYGRTVARVLIQRTSRAEFFTFDFACKMISLGVCTEYVKFSNNYYRSCKP